MNVPSTLSSATPSSKSDLRPRHRRLDRERPRRDDDDDDDDDDQSEPDFRYSSRSPLDPPAVSPFPRPHLPGSRPSRPSPSGGATNRRQPTRDGSQTTLSVVSGLWEGSWSAVQGLASTVIRGDVAGPGGRERSRAPPRPRRQPSSTETARSRWFNGETGPRQWGPEPQPKLAGDAIVSAPRESRDGWIQAKRRHDLLAASEPVVPDSLGRFKRRISDEFGPTLSSSSSAAAASKPPLERHEAPNGEDLVYLHHVKSDDTMAGVIIQFQCQAAAFRKANRLWPNDPIQSRRTVVLPVHACAIKGKPVATPVIPPSNGQRRTRTHANGEPTWWDDIISSHPPSAAEAELDHGDRVMGSPAVSTNSREQHHEEDSPSWKHESWVIIEGHASPVEIVRLPRRTLGYFPPGRRKSPSEGGSPFASLDLTRPLLPRPVRSKSPSKSAAYFGHRLHGPGGVGLLGRETRSPGPGPDRVKSFLAPHLPNLADRDSFESVGSNVSTGLDHVGSAIEGWMKKVASRAAAALSDGAGSVAGCGAASDGDLIELSDGLDPGGGHVRPSDARATTTTMTTSSPTLGAEMEHALRERFPIRPRPAGAKTDINGIRKKGD